MSQSDTTNITKESVEMVYTNCAGTQPGNKFEFPNGPAQSMVLPLNTVPLKRDSIILHADTGLPLGYIIENGEIVQVPNGLNMQDKEETVKD